MNKKCALIKSLLQGDVINVSNSIRLTGYSNPAREIPREVEKPFEVTVSRNKKESKDQFGNYVTWFDYRLNRTEYNEAGIKKMIDYLVENDLTAIIPSGQIIEKPKISKKKKVIELKYKSQTLL